MAMTGYRTADPQQFVGKGYVGMPGSEILAVAHVIDDLGQWQAGSSLWQVTIRLGDGREVKMPTTWRSLTTKTYERKTT